MGLKYSITAHKHKNMAGALSADDETQLKESLEKMGLKVNKVKAIEDLMKVLPKVKKGMKTPRKKHIPLELMRM